MTPYTGGLLLVSKLRADLNRLFQEALQLDPGAPEAGDWTPAVDVRETEDEIVVRVDVPGIAESDLKVFIQGRQLSVEGVRSIVPPTGGRFHCMERDRGKFTRRLRLSAATDPRRSVARLADGLLTVVLPKIRDRRDELLELPIQSEDRKR